MNIKDTPDGQTHFYNDGCGEPEHNNMTISPREEKQAVEKALTSQQDQIEARMKDSIGELKLIEIFYGNPRGEKMIYLDDLLASLPTIIRNTPEHD